MATRDYEFDTGIETDSAPTSSAPTAPGDFVSLGAKTSFTLVNNQSSPANVTGLSFDKSVYRSFILTYQIYRSASGGQTRAENGLIMGITDGANWEISVSPSVTVPNTGDAGTSFTITSAGQIQYTTDDNGGSYLAANSKFEYELLQLMAV